MGDRVESKKLLVRHDIETLLLRHETLQRNGEKRGAILPESQWKTIRFENWLLIVKQKQEKNRAMNLVAAVQTLV